MTARTSNLARPASRKGWVYDRTPGLERGCLARSSTSQTPGRPGGIRARGCPGFTLIELLVVVAIIGILAASSAPAIRSLTQSNTVASGSRQMLDELAYARQLAISARRTVYLVLVPPSMRDHVPNLQRVPAGARQTQMLRQFTNLVNGQYTAYALFSRRTVGDQPGRQTPRYLTEWKHLPEGMFFATNKFIDLGNGWTNVANTSLDITNRPLPFAWFPFPAADSPEMRLPYIAFDPAGRLAYEGQFKPNFPEAALTISRGSIFYPKDARGNFQIGAAADVVATPRTNRIDVLVNWLTGRPKVLELKLP